MVVTGLRNSSSQKISLSLLIVCFESLFFLTLPMRRLLSSEAQGCKEFWIPSKPCHVGIHWKALTDYSLMSTRGGSRGGFEGFVRTPPSWWVILHHHATCGQTSKLVVFPASTTSCNLQFCPRLLFPKALSRQQADWCQPGVGPSGWTFCSRGLSAVNQRIQNYSLVVRRLRIA